MVGIVLDKSTLGLEVGKSAQLTASVLPQNADNPGVTWVSSDPAIASVNGQGLVSGVAAGSATITAASVQNPGVTASAAVIVSASAVPVAGVGIQAPASTSLVAGNSLPLSVSFQPANATNTAVTWSSSNDAVATVNDLGVVTGVAAGTVTITATSADGGYTQSITLTIEPAPAPTFAIGGTLSGLSGGSLELQNNGTAEALTLSANGAFAFANKVSAYNVTVRTQPLGFQACSVTDGSGTATADVANVSVACQGAQAVVSTLAGSPGVPGSTDGIGGAARFTFAADVAVDASGNVYVADLESHTVRKVTPAGEVTTLAGTAGAAGSADGTGAAARFNFPGGVAVDASGNVYVADTVNNAIRKITPEGEVTTLAGTAGAAGSADGTGAAARFRSPADVAVDSSGNVYVADAGNSTIRKITPAGEVTTLAGTAGSTGSVDGTGSAARFTYPGGVAVDSSGNVYVADAGNSTIRKITPAGEVTTLAGTAGATGSADGTGAAARFYNLGGVAVDASGNVYVSDAGNTTIRKITPAGEVTTLAGTVGVYGSVDGTGSAAQFNYPLGLDVDAIGNLYAADGRAVRKITSTP